MNAYFSTLRLHIFGAVIHFFSGLDLILIPKYFCFYTIPLCKITRIIDLTTEVSILLSFTCTALITGNLGRSDVTIYYYIDGLIISNPNARAGGYAGNYSSYLYSVSLNYFSEGLSVGTHNISMLVSSTVDTNDIQYCHLIIQSFSG